MSLIFEQYEERLRRRGRDRSTIGNFNRATALFGQWLRQQALEIEDVTPEIVEDYFVQSSLAPTTKATHLSNLSAAFRYAHSRGILSRNPTFDVELPRVPDTEPRIISSPELRRIKGRLLCDRDWLLFHLLAYTGMRRNEIRTLTWDAVSLEEETLRVVGKGGKLRHVPIHPALGEELAKLDRVGDGPVLPSPGRYIAEQTMQDALKRMSPDHSAHDYRRTVATSLARNGVDERVIDRIMGWAPRTVRGRYYVNVATEETKRGILRLYADDPV